MNYSIKKPNLFLFPELPNEFSGYGWAVKSDLKNLDIQHHDVIVFFTRYKIKDQDHSLVFKNISSKNIHVIFKKKNILRNLYSLLKLQHPSFFLSSDWMELPRTVRELNYDKIFIGDIIFYPIINFLKGSEYNFRFHNLWLRILLSFKWNIFDIKNLINMLLISKSEYKILKNETNIYLISKKDKSFATKYNINPGLLLIDISIFKEKKLLPIKTYFNKPAIIWYGSVSTHKKHAIISFIKIYKKLKNKNNFLNFILFGKGTEQFNNKKFDIYGRGFFEDPSKIPVTQKCIFINPDLTGGGVKIKNFEIIKIKELFLLSTPEGFEGCEDYEREGVYIKKIEEWLDFLHDFFN